VGIHAIVMIFWRAHSNISI